MREASTPLLIADDHPIFREGLRGVIVASSRCPAPRSSATGDGAEAVAHARELERDVVLMDLSMPVLNGVEATREMGAADLPCAVLMLTMLEGEDSLVAALTAGARGYLVKGAGRDEIARALRDVARGHGRLWHRRGRTGRSRVSPPRSLAAPQHERRAARAHPREVEVLDLAATPVSTIFGKLGVEALAASGRLSTTSGRAMSGVACRDGQAPGRSRPLS